MSHDLTYNYILVERGTFPSARAEDVEEERYAPPIEIRYSPNTELPKTTIVCSVHPGTGAFIFQFRKFAYDFWREQTSTALRLFKGRQESQRGQSYYIYSSHLYLYTCSIYFPRTHQH